MSRKRRGATRNQAEEVETMLADPMGLQVLHAHHETHSPLHKDYKHFFLACNVLMWNGREKGECC
jgi:hypothetical protein